MGVEGAEARRSCGWSPVDGAEESGPRGVVDGCGPAFLVAERGQHHGSRRSTRDVDHTDDGVVVRSLHHDGNGNRLRCRSPNVGRCPDEECCEREEERGGSTADAGHRSPLKGEGRRRVASSLTPVSRRNGAWSLRFGNPTCSCLPTVADQCRNLTGFPKLRCCAVAERYQSRLNGSEGTLRPTASSRAARTSPADRLRRTHQGPR